MDVIQSKAGHGAGNDSGGILPESIGCLVKLTELNLKLTEQRGKTGESEAPQVCRCIRVPPSLKIVS